MSGVLFSPLRTSSRRPLARDSNAAERLLAIPSIGLGAWPTPIQRVARSGRPDVLVKRDDQCGHGRGGSKARKIEHVVGHLLERGCDELITVAGNVTNLAFDLLPALDRSGIRSRLFILDDPPVLAPDRERVFEGVRDKVELIGRSRVQAFGSAVAAYARSKLRGGKPFLALPGLSHPAAVVGSARGFFEMIRQLGDAGGPLPSKVYVTAATGTTLAGMLLAEHVLRSQGHQPVRIVGVKVYPGPVRRRTSNLLSWTEHFLSLAQPVPRDRIEIATSALHGGFGRYPQELSELCERVAAESGIHIDPIFGGKTWSVMEQDLASGRDRRPTLYWHCGYTPEWRVLGAAVGRGSAR